MTCLNKEIRRWRRRTAYRARGPADTGYRDVGDRPRKGREKSTTTYWEDPIVLRYRVSSPPPPQKRYLKRDRDRGAGDVYRGIRPGRDNGDRREIRNGGRARRRLAAAAAATTASQQQVTGTVTTSVGRHLVYHTRAPIPRDRSFLITRVRTQTRTHGRFLRTH